MHRHHVDDGERPRLTLDRQGWDLRYGGDELVFTADPSRFLAGEVSGLAPGRALDLGSGEGRNALWLAERGWSVTGVDFSAVGAAKARRLAQRRNLRSNWVVADLRTFQPLARTFDLVLQFFVHFLPMERRDLLRRSGASLRPGGLLLVVGYDVSHLTEGCGGGPRDPERLFTPEGLVADLADLADVHVERADRLRVRTGGDEAGADGHAVNVVVRARCLVSRPVDG